MALTCRKVCLPDKVDSFKVRRRRANVTGAFLAHFSYPKKEFA